MTSAEWAAPRISGGYALVFRGTQYQSMRHGARNSLHPRGVATLERELATGLPRLREVALQFNRGDRRKRTESKDGRACRHL